MNEMQPEYILSLWVTLNQNNQCSQSGTDRKRNSKKAGLPDPKHMPSTRKISSVPHRVDQRAQNLVGKCARCEIETRSVAIEDKRRKRRQAEVQELGCGTLKNE